VSRVARQVDEALTGVTKASARFREIRSRLLPAISAAQAAADRARSLAAPSPGLRLRLEISRLRAHRRALATEEELIEAQIRLRSVLGRD